MHGDLIKLVGNKDLFNAFVNTIYIFIYQLTNTITLNSDSNKRMRNCS